MSSHLQPIDPEKLEELRQLACLVSRESDLRLVAGPAGSGWRYSHSKRRISMDSQGLRTQSWAFNKGLVLHECGHAGITRLHPLLKKDPYLREPPIFGLINCLEDCRLETWLQVRFPGCTPWIQHYNDILLRVPYAPERRVVHDHQRLPHFISAVLNRWWFREAAVAANEQIRALTERVWPHVEAICQAYPRGEMSLEAARQAFVDHPMSSIYDEVPLPPGREAWELEVRLCQLRMWDEFTTVFLPILREFEPPGRHIVCGRRFLEWLERWLDEGHLGPDQLAAGHGRIPCRIILRGGGQEPGRTTHPWFSEESAADSWPLDPVAYRASRESQAAVIEQVGEEVLRLLHPRIDREWAGPWRSGTRLDLRAALRAEADPQRLDQVWEHRQPPSRHDASITLLLDHSTSMKGPRIDATLWATVLLAEVCHRVGIPLVIFTFSDDCHLLLDVDEPLDAAIQGRLGGLPQSASGGTHLAFALSHVHRRVLDLGTADPFVVVLSDGIPSDDDDPKARVDEMERDGITVLGLGLGPDSARLAEFISCCQPHLQSTDIADAFIRILIQASSRRHALT